MANKVGKQGKENRLKGTGTKSDRDWKKHYAYNASPEQKKYRAELNRKNNELKREGKQKVGDKIDVAHKKARVNGGSIAKNGYKLQAQSKNRAGGGKLKKG
jgi:hypothetical protein